jgi:hypothetical protein
MRKYRLNYWNNVRWIFCLVSLATRLYAVAQSDANGNDTRTHEVGSIPISTASWETRDLPNIRLRFKLPPSYKQKQWAVVVGSPRLSATFRLGHENHIHFTVEDVDDADLERAKIGRQKDYVDYREWSQLVGGRKGIVQTFQGGIVSDEQGEHLVHCVEAVCALDGKHVLRISAGLENQERQQEVVAMLKTIEFY